MASGTGTVTIDFGALPGSNEAEAIVTGLADIAATAKCEAWVMGDDSSVDHTAADHRYLPLFACFTCGPPIRRRGTRVFRAPYPQVKRHRTRKQRENDFLFLQ